VRAPDGDGPPHALGAETLVLTPGGHDVTSPGGVCVRASGEAKDAEPDDLYALVLCGATIWKSGDAPDLSAPVRRFVAVGLGSSGLVDYLDMYGNEHRAAAG
jgi:hypothetical protein